MRPRSKYTIKIISLDEDGIDFKASVLPLYIINHLIYYLVTFKNKYFKLGIFCRLKKGNFVWETKTQNIICKKMKI